MNNASFTFEDHWGKSAHMDLIECEHERLISPEILKQFVEELIKEVNMIAHGPCHIERFGSPEENLEGYSAMQFIETSTITLHLDEVNNRAYIDLFSCQDFDAPETFEFAKKYFGAQNGKLTVLER
ncbi:MAG: S-adenosylmethionine decarboxylase [bacterium]|nr:S-adenosylmethionine decarboxylase [bacterium]